MSDHWLSAESAPVVAVLLDDGGVLVGTPHHRVPTPMGPTHMGTLRNGDMLYAWQGIGASQARSNSSGTAAGTAEIPTRLGAITGSTGSPRRRPAPTCIGTSTSRSADRYLWVGTSTTRTATPSTTAPGTSWANPATSTLATTTPNGLAALTSATSADPTSLPASGPTTFAGARRLARNGGAGVLVSLTSRRGAGHIETAERATNVGPPSRLIAPGQGSALRRVVAVLDAGVAPVWNLSVEYVHEYVANGVFVHNSIRNAAMRFGVALDLWIKGHGEDDERSAVSDDRQGPARSKPAPDPDQVKASDDIIGEFKHLASQLGEIQTEALKAWFKKHQVPAVDKASRRQVLDAIKQAEELRSHTGPVFADPVGPKPPAEAQVEDIAAKAGAS